MQPMTIFPRPSKRSDAHRRAARISAAHRRRLRGLVILAAACAAILLAGIVVAQASRHYDLACRGVLDSGGGYRVTPSQQFALVDATGQPIAGISQSNRFGVYGGYIHPYKPAPSPSPEPPPDPPPAFANKLTLPFISQTMRVVRGGC